MDKPGRLVISFGEAGFEGLSQTWHRVLLLMAKQHQVLHVLPHYYLREAPHSLQERWKSSSLRLVHGNLYQYRPSWLLTKSYRSSRMNQVMDSINTVLVKRTAQMLSPGRPILLIWHPRYANMVGKFNESLLCYYIYDDFFGYGGGEPEAVHLGDQMLLQRADLVFASSRALERKAAQFSPNVHCIPNGADSELFSAMTLGSEPEPADLARIPRPRIGYTGNLNRKVDYELIASLASSQPDWSFVLVGPVNVPESRMDGCTKLPNVHLLGARDYRQVPRYVAGLDACFMPYVLDGWVISGYPLKLHEYLAAGKPIVSADLESVREFSHVVRIAREPKDWQRQILNALQDTRPEQVRLRKHIASENSWERRVQQIELLMRAKLTEQMEPRLPQPAEVAEANFVLNDGGSKGGIG